MYADVGESRADANLHHQVIGLEDQDVLWSWLREDASRSWAFTQIPKCAVHVGNLGKNSDLPPKVCQRTPLRSEETDAHNSADRLYADRLDGKGNSLSPAHTIQDARHSNVLPLPWSKATHTQPGPGNGCLSSAWSGIPSFRKGSNFDFVQIRKRFNHVLEPSFHDGHPVVMRLDGM